MTVPRINAMISYWKENCPPACRALAALIGFKPQASSTEKAQEAAAEEFMAAFPMAKSHSIRPGG